MGLRTTKNTAINHSFSGLTAGFRKVAGRRVLCAAFDLSLKTRFLICRKYEIPIETHILTITGNGSACQASVAERQRLRSRLQKRRESRM